LILSAIISVLIATTVRLFLRPKAKVRFCSQRRAPLSLWSTDELCRYGILGNKTSSNADTAILGSSWILRSGRGEAIIIAHTTICKTLQQAFLSDVRYQNRHRVLPLGIREVVAWHESSFGMII
jgi:hypothetical protein